MPETFLQARAVEAPLEKTKLVRPYVSGDIAMRAYLSGDIAMRAKKWACSLPGATLQQDSGDLEDLRLLTGPAT